ncbi:hypothetical protein [Roseivirga pacifica]|uniref:hypothetical protein n=1 Tax=Roseivirga pacifica TaxID=1267423 RepID=UPI003BAFDF74
MNTLLDDIKKTGLKNSLIKEFVKFYSIDEIQLENNYEFATFLREKGLDWREIIKEEENTIIEFYIQFLILSLINLSNPSQVKGLLREGARKSSSETEWLIKVNNMMEKTYSNALNLPYSQYNQLRREIDLAIEEIEVREENLAARKNKPEIEMPIDMIDHDYTIRLKDLQKYKPIRLKKNTEEFRSAYFQELENRLLTGLSSTEIEPFLKHQLRYIDDKINWLRYVDRLVNKSNRQRNDHQRSNDSVLMELIPRLIYKLNRQTNQYASVEYDKISFIGIESSTVLKTQFTIPELVLLFDILNTSGYLDTDSITKNKLADFISDHFTTPKSPKGIKAGSVLTAMKKTNHEAYYTLDEKLDRLRQLLKSESESIG